MAFMKVIMAGQKKEIFRQYCCSRKCSKNLEWYWHEYESGKNDWSKRGF